MTDQPNPAKPSLGEMSERATQGPWFATASTAGQTPVDYDADSLTYAPNLTERGPSWGEEGDGAERMVFTVSTSPDYAGWKTDSGFPGYGIREEDALFIAACVNRVRELLTTEAGRAMLEGEG
jgi:hypothetical protein